MGKTNVSEERDSVKISKLGEELGVDPREIVAAAKEMTMENAKVPASWVTAGQADRLRAKFGGNKALKEKLERRQQFRETGTLPEDAASKPKTHTPKLGKETFEHDRRKIFGVVETAGGVKVETSGPSGITAKPAVTGITKPAAHTAAETKHNLAAELPAAKKFIGIQVNPPIRREPGKPDERFGVVAAAPESEKPKMSDAPVTQPPADLWGKLNDGRAPIEMAAASSSLPLPTGGESGGAAADEAQEEIAPEAVKEEPKIQTNVPDSVMESVAAPAAAEEVEEEDEEENEIEAAQPTRAERKNDGVPVKLQPKHKAFGAKMKLKHKKHKKLQASGDSHRAPAHGEAKAPKKAEPAKPQAAAHPPKKKHPERVAPREGFLTRLRKKLLGK